jgi:hypothetical protein
VRTAISFCRASARASSRFATLAQAISSTSPTAPMSSHIFGRTLPTRSSSSGWITSGCSSGLRLWVSATSFSQRFTRPAISDRA